jgi:hypothetical protein
MAVELLPLSEQCQTLGTLSGECVLHCIGIMADDASASYDILRLYDLKEPPSTRSTVPFLIVPGHRTGVVSQLYMDPACRFMISTGGNRGWEGLSTEVLLGYEINVVP